MASRQYYNRYSDFIINGEQTVLPFVIGSVGVWLYYRDRFTDILNDLADKKAIIAALANHSDDLEKQNVKKLLKESNKKTSKEVKVKKPRIAKK